MKPKLAYIVRQQEASAIVNHIGHWPTELMKPLLPRYLLMALMLVCATVLTVLLRNANYFFVAVICCFTMYWFGLVADE